MFVIKTIYKVTNLKVHSKGRFYLFIFLIPFQELQANGSFGLQSCFPLIVTSEIVIPPTRIQLVGRWGNAWVSSARFEIETCAGVFISLYF